MKDEQKIFLNRGCVFPPVALMCIGEELSSAS
jgi:hypothetical protein